MAYRDLIKIATKMRAKSWDYTETYITITRPSERRSLKRAKHKVARQINKKLIRDELNNLKGEKL